MSSNPMVGQDEGTQRMVNEAQQNFPDKPLDDAMQQQADMGPGREAAQGEGGSSGIMGGTSGVMESVKGAAASAMDTLKQANPATRDMKEGHC